MVAQCLQVFWTTCFVLGLWEEWGLGSNNLNGEAVAVSNFRAAELVDVSIGVSRIQESQASASEWLAGASRPRKNIL